MLQGSKQIRRVLRFVRIWGKGVQEQLLEQDGVIFLPDGRVDLQRCLWRPDGEELR